MTERRHVGAGALVGWLVLAGGYGLLVWALRTADGWMLALPVSIGALLGLGLVGVGYVSGMGRARRTHVEVARRVAEAQRAREQDSGG